MKQMTFALCLVLSCWIIPVAAQRAPTPAIEPAHNVFLLTGCLERGDAPSAFRLVNASAVGQAVPRQITSPDKGTYELQATSSVSEQGLSDEKLQPEVGTRVEVTIRPVEAAAASAPPQPAAGNPAEKPAESPRQRYTVIKLERLEGSCK